MAITKLIIGALVMSLLLTSILSMIATPVFAVKKESESGTSSSSSEVKEKEKESESGTNTVTTTGTEKEKEKPKGPIYTIPEAPDWVKRKAAEQSIENAKWNDKHGFPDWGIANVKPKQGKDNWREKDHRDDWWNEKDRDKDHKNEWWNKGHDDDNHDHHEVKRITIHKGTETEVITMIVLPFAYTSPISGQYYAPFAGVPLNEYVPIPSSSLIVPGFESAIGSALAEAEATASVTTP